MARVQRRSPKKRKKVVLLIPASRLPMLKASNPRPALEPQLRREPSAPTLFMAGLALLISLILAGGAVIGAMADVSACNIFPALALPIIWLPLVASGFAIRAVARNQRAPRAKYRRAFTTALWCWLLLMPLAVYAGLSTFDVQVHTSACSLYKPDTPILGPPLN